MLNVLIIGCGGIAPAHIEGYLNAPEHCRVVALADADTARAGALIEKYGLSEARAYADYRDALADADIASICTPPGTHREMAVAALESGCHVLLEKPMAPSLSDCDAIIAAAEANSRVLSVVAQSRYISSIRNAIAIVREGAYGRALYSRVHSVWYRGQGYYDLAWRGRWQVEGGGCTLNHSIHHIDLLLWAKGLPQSITATILNLAHDNSEEEDFASALLRYPDGTVAELTSSLISHGEPQLLTFQMEQAGLQIPFRALASRARENGFPENDRDMAARLAADYAARPQLPLENHDGQVRNFLAAILSGEALVADGQDGRRAIELISGLYKAAITGAPAGFPLQPEDPFYTGAWRGSAPHFHEKSKDVAAFADTTITSFKGKF